MCETLLVVLDYGLQSPLEPGVLQYAVKDIAHFVMLLLDFSFQLFNGLGYSSDVSEHGQPERVVVEV